MNGTMIQIMMCLHYSFIINVTVNTLNKHKCTFLFIFIDNISFSDNGIWINL